METQEIIHTKTRCHGEKTRGSVVVVGMQPESSGATPSQTKPQTYAGPSESAISDLVPSHLPKKAVSASTTGTTSVKVDEKSPATPTADDSGIPSTQVPRTNLAGKAIGVNALTPEKQQRMVELHNLIREANGQTPLGWSDKLASFGDGWTAQCALGIHSGGYAGPG